MLFLEHKRLYREPYNRSPHPGADYTIPFGKARIGETGHRPDHRHVRRAGAEVAAGGDADRAAEPGRIIEVIDLRCLPLRLEGHSRHPCEKTNRVMVAHEDTLSWGFGAEIAARIANELFSSLDAPVGRVAALDTWVGYHPQLEAEILPQVEDIEKEAERLVAY